MEYYRTCPDCGAALDPGETCDGQEPPELESYLGEGDDG